MRRSAFTLVEMLVVIVLALLLMTLALMVVPNLSDKRAAARAADQLQGWLAQARSRAMRDQSPRGLRLIANGLEVRELEFVDQPAPFLPVATSGQFATLPARLYIPEPDPSPATGVQFVNAWIANYTNAADIRVGDFLELIHGAVAVYQITAIQSAVSKNLPATEGGNQTGTRLTLSTPIGPYQPLDLGNGVILQVPIINHIKAAGQVVLPGRLPQPGQPANYRIIRGPRPLTGEPILQLPAHTLIDLDKTGAPPNPVIDEDRRYGRPLPVIGGFPTILFAPSGSLIGTTASNPVILWVRHDGNQGAPTLITVDPKNGAITAHPVNDMKAPGMQFRLANPFQFVDDGLSSGL